MKVLTTSYAKLNNDIFANMGIFPLMNLDVVFIMLFLFFFFDSKRSYASATIDQNLWGFIFCYFFRHLQYFFGRLNCFLVFFCWSLFIFREFCLEFKYSSNFNFNNFWLNSFSISWFIKSKFKKEAFLHQKYFNIFRYEISSRSSLNGSK